MWPRGRERSNKFYELIMPGTHQPTRPHTTSIFPPVTKPSLTPPLSIQRTTPVTCKHKAKYKDEHNNNVNDKAFKINSLSLSLSSLSSVSTLSGGSNVSSVSSVGSDICRQLVDCCTTYYLVMSGRQKHSCRWQQIFQFKLWYVRWYPKSKLSIVN